MDIALLYGGTSSEVNVSRSSAEAIAKALKQNGHSVREFDWDERRIITKVESLDGFDVVFLGYHGGAGEDGHVQAVLELAGIPFTGSGSVASALAMNKVLSKYLFERVNIPSAAWCIVDKNDTSIDIVQKMSVQNFNLPVVIKPISQGSTVGISIVRSPDELEPAIESAFQFGDEIIIEKYISGKEITVAILGFEALPVVDIIAQNGFYDYQHKYTHGFSNYVCPADIGDDISQRLQKIALRAYRILGCRHYARVDFRLSENNEPFCLEVNTLPGMTDLSLVPMAAKEAGIDFPELVERIAKMGAVEDK